MEKTEDGDEVFRWVALAGQLSGYVGGTTPREFSPCGVCLNRNNPQLSRYPERLFTYFADARPIICEALVIPFSVEGVAAGTIWIVSHDPSKQFDAEDVRSMARLADFTAAAYRLNMEVAERKRAKAALRDLDTRKDRFLAALAHEMRQPVAAMLPALALMRARPDMQVGQHARLLIERQVEQLQHMLDDLIDLARFAEGKVTLHKTTVDLRDVAADTAAVTMALFKERRQRLSVSLGTTPAYVLGDQARLQQVVSNLLSDSARYARDGGEVSLRVEVDDDVVRLCVQDDGAGIGPEALSHIFEPFVQLDTDRPGRLGIGLTVVRQLVTLHDGIVEARSSGLGHGAEFVVTLAAAINAPP